MGAAGGREINLVIFVLFLKRVLSVCGLQGLHSLFAVSVLLGGRVGLPYNFNQEFRMVFFKVIVVEYDLVDATRLLVEIVHVQLSLE